MSVKKIFCAIALKIDLSLLKESALNNFYAMRKKDKKRSYKERFITYKDHTFWGT
ncbi:MAG: hypothetical protein JKY09_06940 [Crocinitomicaceae bacterium]|nr:hypothetical protein [Crocinitomicaceae bacterium]